MTVSGTSPLRLTLLCGNPRPASRTLAAAGQVADALEGATSGTTWTRTVVDLADLATELFAPARPGVDNALSLVTHSDVLVVATPVYKGSYTGLLKSFLDRLPHQGLHGAAPRLPPADAWAGGNAGLALHAALCLHQRTQREESLA
jgi:FMN reductase